MKKIQKIIIISFVLFAFTHNVYASVLSINTDKNEIQTGGLANIVIKLDTENKSINTVEGDLIYDKNLLKVEQINIGNSFVSFWVEKPSVINEGKIHFSGIVPGGIATSSGDIFTVIFRGSRVGKASISLANMNLFLNDGVGTKDEVSVNNTNLIITQNTTKNEEQITKNDTTPPKIFTIERTRNIYVYDNKWYLAYSTQDKESGVDYYEVCEFTRRNCIKADSPYLLKYQTPFYRVIVRAYDIDGNRQDIVLTSGWLVTIIVLLIVGFVYLGLYLYHRYLHKYRV